MVRNAKILILLFMIFPLGCASKPEYKGSGELCGYIVDENNHPVEEYVISCRRNTGVWKSVLTNEDGLFVFEEEKLGKFYFKGQKEGFVNLDKSMQLFGNKAKVVCFQVSSIEKALDEVEEMILCQNFKEAGELAGKIHVSGNWYMSKVVNYYKKFIQKKIKESKKGDEV